MSLDEKEPDRHDATPAEEPSSDADGEENGGEGESKEKGDAGGKQDGGKEGGDDPGKKDKEQQKAAKKASPWVKLIAVVVLLAAAAGGTYYYFATRDEQSTDDAYTDGRALTIAPKVAGYVVDLLADDNQFVKAGDVLVRIDPRDYIVARDAAQAALLNIRAQENTARLNAEIARKNFPARLLQAQGQLQQAQGQLFQSQTDYKRQHAVSREATTQQSIDQSTAQLQLAQGQVTVAQAAVQQAEPVQQNIATADEQISQIGAQIKSTQTQLEQAELNLGYTVIKAPQDGWITKRNVERGNYLQVGSTIFSIVTPQVWVTANFKETELGRIRPGQKVRIHVDAYPDLKLMGHVDSIQLGSGSKFTAFPPENATGNFVKIVQRVPVKIVIDSGLDPARPLPLGISVEPTVLLN